MTSYRNPIGFQSLTEYNTALNRRIAAIAGAVDNNIKLAAKRVKKKDISVCFLDEEDIINPGMVINHG